MNKIRTFYDAEYKKQSYAFVHDAGKHFFSRELKEFIAKYNLHDKRCLEVGCGRGAFQDLVEDYTGLDISREVRRYMHKPFIAGSATDLPFSDDHFDALWSVTVLEHVPEPEKALQEMCRVLKRGGFLFLAPAWQCRPWARDGYPVRPYSDFGFKGKLIKLSIIVRDTVWFRSLFVFPLRAVGWLKSHYINGPLPLRYKKLEANYEIFWMADSDACCSIDPYEAVLWFSSRGHDCLSHITAGAGFLVRSGPVIFRINK